ncbi:hypothetical protein HPB48_025702 [Haemaphysalis longicornis]|uniref:Uncharacterized protein n=1 Tax=Haemaphysalis longicornis TaxID=44386 RepID=A0A9J6GZK6_HAELO|nr:hypothetical protein HPB48_025702 [Haemaphysalis longicornis]
MRARVMRFTRSSPQMAGRPARSRGVSRANGAHRRNVRSSMDNIFMTRTPLRCCLFLFFFFSFPPRAQNADDEDFPLSPDVSRTPGAKGQERDECKVTVLSPPLSISPRTGANASLRQSAVRCTGRHGRRGGSTARAATRILIPCSPLPPSRAATCAARPFRKRRKKQAPSKKQRHQHTTSPHRRVGRRAPSPATGDHDGAAGGAEERVRAAARTQFKVRGRTYRPCRPPPKTKRNYYQEGGLSPAPHNPVLPLFCLPPSDLASISVYIIPALLRRFSDTAWGGIRRGEQGKEMYHGARVGRF